MNATLENFVALLRRYPYGAVCAAATLLLAGAAWFLRGQVADLERVRADRTKEWEAMLTTLVGGMTQRQELAAVRDATRRIDDNLMVEANLAENLWYFYKLEEQTKARLPEVHPLNSPVTDAATAFRRLPYTLRINGTFEQVSAYLLALETGPRLVKITSFSFARRGSGVGATVELDLSLEVLGKK